MFYKINLYKSKVEPAIHPHLYQYTLQDQYNFCIKTLTQALRDAASTRSGTAVPSGAHPYSALDSAPVLTEELKRHLVESRAATDYRSQQELRHQPRDKMETQQHPVDQDEMGPIRIRNLEDLIRYGNNKGKPKARYGL